MKQDVTFSPPMKTKTNSKEELWAQLEAIVGREHLRAATVQDRVDGVAAQMVAEPATEAELANVVKAADAAGIKIVPRGAGTKLDWGNKPLSADLILSTARLNRVLEHAWGDMTATVEAGCTVQQFQNILAEHRQRLAIDPLWPERATIGGILATKDSGSLRVRFGTLRDLIIGATLVLSDGTIAKSGGKVVKNVAGYDLPKLATGSLGTLGVITTAIFRLHPLPRETASVTVSAESTAALQKLASAIHDSQLAYTGLQLRVQSSGSPKLDVRFEGTAAGISEQLQQLAAMSSHVRSEKADHELWNARNELFTTASNSVTVKFSVLPAELGNFCDAVNRVAERKLDWKIVAQSVGVGLIQMICWDTKALVQALIKLRTETEKMGKLGEMSGGSLIVLRCPTEMKSRFDVWGPPSDAQPLFIKMKQQFDPKGTLNPGRFIGGI